MSHFFDATNARKVHRVSNCITGAKVPSLLKSTLGFCENPCAQSHALYLISFPFSSLFFTNTHLHPMGFLPSGNFASSQVPIFFSVPNSSSMAFFHWSPSSPFSASLMVMGFSVSSSSRALKKVASLKIDSRIFSVATWACSGLMDLAHEDSVDCVISGGSDGMIGGLLMHDGALLPQGASINSTVLCHKFNWWVSGSAGVVCEGGPSNFSPSACKPGVSVKSRCGSSFSLNLNFWLLLTRRVALS